MIKTFAGDETESFYKTGKSRVWRKEILTRATRCLVQLNAAVNVEDLRLPPSNNPDGAPSGVYRVNRGGGWNDFGRHLRSAYKAAHSPVNRTFNLGFRVARNAN
jgi:formylglycine-generating enzyme required for sulfatase activity